jgi:rhodanese-related sulfurtransferase
VVDWNNLLAGAAGLVPAPAPPDAPEITVAEFLRDGVGAKAQVVDVREPDEWAAGHMPGSVLIPMGEVGSRLGELDRERPVVTVCRSGRRSLFSAAELLEAGLRDVRSLAGGMIAWVEAGQPVEY